MEYRYEIDWLSGEIVGQGEQWYKRSTCGSSTGLDTRSFVVTPTFTRALCQRDPHERKSNILLGLLMLTRKLFLDLLDPSNCPAIQSSTLLALVTSLLDCPQNTRTFETIDGLLVVTSLFKSRSTSREVKLKLVEFLYFYLMPETAPPKMSLPTSATNTAVLGGRGRELVAAFDRRRETITTVENSPSKAGSKTRNTDEKQNMLSKYMNNVQDLVEDLREGGGPFGH